MTGGFLTDVAFRRTLQRHRHEYEAILARHAAEIAAMATRHTVELETATAAPQGIGAEIGMAAGALARRNDTACLFAAVEETFGFDEESVRARSRMKSLVHVRHLTVYVARQELHLSYPELGRLFGRDHTSMLHSVRKVADTCAAGDTAYVVGVQRLTERLRFSLSRSAA